jgi:DNA-binding NarL/FixJ family response regulator
MSGMVEIVPVKILLIDDHQLFNDGIRVLLSSQPDLDVCGQVFEEKDIFFSLRSLTPDLVLLDLNIQGRSGLEIGVQIMARQPQTKIVILTMYNQPKLLDEARKAGFHGYMLKESNTTELLEGIRTVIAGRKYYDSRLVAQLPLSTNTFQDDFALRANLTFREVEVIRLIREGLTSEQIAEQLNLSQYTVKTHRRNIYFKLSIGNVAELIEFANRNRL